MEASAGYTGPYPTEVAGEVEQGLEGAGPLPAGGTDQSATTAPPSVAAEPHEELEASSPAPSNSASPGNTAAPPALATSLGSSPGSVGSGTPGAGLANGQAAAAFGAALPTVSATPGLTLADKQLEKPAEPGPPAIASRTTVLPTVSATPLVSSFAAKGTS